nr:unnamed protein product [Digitaria exilis]CAB3503015.1 unnamed protein product [Digitaria exilis]
MSGWGLDLGGGWRCPKGLSSQLVAYDEEMVPWLEELAKTASAVFPNVLDQADPQPIVSRLRLPPVGLEQSPHPSYVRWGAVTNEAANSRISDADEAVAWQWNISRLEHQFLGSKSAEMSCDSDYCEALLSSIKKWHYLKFLTIHCGLGCSMEFLGSLSSPPRWLEKFKATTGRFACVPQWFHGLECLSFVQITVCKLEAHDLEILRDLYSLKCLVLGLDFIPKEAIVIKNEGFRALQRFSIECPVPWLTFESRAMPMLKYLQLDFHACPTSPASVPMGISNLCSLAEVALWYNVRYANSSSIKSTVKAVRDEVAECHSATATQMLRLLVNGIEQDDIQAVDEETQGATGPPTGTSAGVEDAVQEADEIMEA